MDQRSDFDHLEAEAYSALGDRAAVFLDLGEPKAVERAMALAERSQAIVIGLDRDGALPAIDPGAFDVLISTAEAAPSPWVPVPCHRLDARLAAMKHTISCAPIAAATFAWVLKIGQGLPVREALLIESHAYSMLLAGSEFSRWLSVRQAARQVTGGGAQAYVEVGRNGDLVTIST